MHAPQKIQKTNHGETGLLDDGSERAALEVSRVPRQGDPGSGGSRMLQNVMTTGDVMDLKAGPLERSQNVLRLERRKSSTHADSGTSTRISSLTGVLSEGMGR